VIRPAPVGSVSFDCRVAMTEPVDETVAITLPRWTRAGVPTATGAAAGAARRT
jgi:hypothetical protein